MGQRGLAKGVSYGRLTISSDPCPSCARSPGVSSLRRRVRRLRALLRCSRPLPRRASSRRSRSFRSLARRRSRRPTSRAAPRPERTQPSATRSLGETSSLRATRCELSHPTQSEATQGESGSVGSGQCALSRPPRSRRRTRAGGAVLLNPRARGSGCARPPPRLAWGASRSLRDDPDRGTRSEARAGAADGVADQRWWRGPSRRRRT